MSLSCTVSETFNVEEWRALEITVRGHARSLEMAPFDRSHTSSYSSSIVTMAISCIVSTIKRDILIENCDYFIQMHLTPR